MHWKERFIKALVASFAGSDKPPPGRVNPSRDSSVDGISEAARRIAQAAAGLDATDVEDVIAKFVAGSLNAHFHEQATVTEDEVFAEKAKGDHADNQQAVAEDVAQELLEEMDRVASKEGARKAGEEVAEAEIDEALELVGRLPLIEKVKTSWRLALLAMIATSAGVGTLARLSLENVTDTSARSLITVAAVGGAFASELVLGTLGAEAYDRLTPARRRWALLIVIITVLGALIGTEVLAAFARQAGVNGTNEFTIDQTTGQPKLAGSLTPSLLWTAPLAILVTLSGSGIVGLARLRETSKPMYDGLARARSRLADARKALKEDERRVTELREKATSTRERAARLRGEASAAHAGSERLLGALDQLAKRHAELINAVTAEAILEYRIAAAERVRHPGKASEPPRRNEAPHRLPALVGMAGAVGTAAGLATASLALGVLAASLVLIAANFRTA